MARPDGGTERKRKIHPRDEAAEAATKMKATSKQDLPTGVRKLRSGKFQARITWGDKHRTIGTFDATPEQASAAYVSVQKERSIK